MFQKVIFKNGLRVVLVPSKNTQAVAVLVLVATGSKYENKSQNGLSHFLEHMFFKGTKKRPNALKLAEDLDKVGGFYNAFTSKEYTGYWVKIHSQYLDLALDWVSDIFLNSKIEKKEIEKEKQVIIEELNMYLDTPTRYIGDLWEELLYPDQPAGWKTIGSPENILRVKRKDLLSYFKNHYSCLNTIICVAGNFHPKKALEKIKKYFKEINQKPPKNKMPVEEKQDNPQVLSFFKKTDQTHLCLGVRGYHLFHPQRYAQEILAVILGGNMSSRVFIEIRERRGLAYYISTSAEFYTDHGYLVTQAGVAHRDLKKVIALILKEYQKIKEKKISPQELRKAKDYLKGSLVLSLESCDAQASFYGIQELLTGKILTLKEKFNLIEKVTSSEVKKVARDIFQPQKLNLALIGPHKDDKVFKKLLKGFK